MEATIDKLRADKADFGTIWLDIERYAWPADLTHNRNFITGLIQGAKVIFFFSGIFKSLKNSSCHQVSLTPYLAILKDFFYF